MNTYGHENVLPHHLGLVFQVIDSFFNQTVILSLPMGFLIRHNLYEQGKYQHSFDLIYFIFTVVFRIIWTNAW